MPQGKPSKRANSEPHPARRPLQLNDLTQPQWAAALHAARILREADPNDPEDRARFRAAKARLVGQLPADADPIDIIGQAVRFYALNDIAAAIACLPEEAVVA